MKSFEICLIILIFIIGSTLTSSLKEKFYSEYKQAAIEKGYKFERDSLGKLVMKKINIK